MIKRILNFLTAIIIVFAVSYFSNLYLLQSKEITISFTLLSVYLFHSIAAIIIYSIVEFVADKMPNQAGYAYLASVFLKIGFFVLIFKATVFTNESLAKAERLSLVIPLFIFLITEAIAISKLLNSK